MFGFAVWTALAAVLTLGGVALALLARGRTPSERVLIALGTGSLVWAFLPLFGRR